MLERDMHERKCDKKTKLMELTHCEFSFLAHLNFHPTYCCYTLGASPGADAQPMRWGEPEANMDLGGSDYRFASGVLGHFPNASCVLR